MAITPKPVGSIDPPNDKTAKAEGTVDAPNDLTAEAAGTIAIPIDKTAQPAGTIAVPNDLTPEAEGSIAIPNDVTAQPAGSIAIPINKTAQAVGQIATPNDLAAQSPVAMSRILMPDLEANFESDVFSSKFNNSGVGFDELFTYDRASSATYLDKRKDANGNEFYVIREDYVGDVTNQISNSTNISGWIKSGLVTEYDDAIKTPVGVGSWFIREDLSMAGHDVRFGFTSALVENISMYVKRRKGDREITIRSSGQGDIYASFDLESGKVITLSGTLQRNAKIDYLGDDWFRLSITFDGTTNDFTSIIVALRQNGQGGSLVSYDGDGVSGFFITGVQVTQSEKIQPYVETTGSAETKSFTAQPRIEHSKNQGVAGVLLESVNTNNLQESERFGDAYWAKNEVTIEDSNRKAPDGTHSAKFIVPTAVDANHSISKGTQAIAGGSYQIFAKAAGYDYLLLTSHSSSSVQDRGTWFDLKNGVIAQQSTGQDALMVDVGDGWYLCWINEGDFPSSIYTAMIAMDLGDAGFAGDGIRGIELWGAQANSAPILSSYIATFGTTATRSSDALDFSSRYIDDNEYTVFMELDHKSFGDKQRYILSSQVDYPTSGGSSYFVTISSESLRYKQGTQANQGVLDLDPDRYYKIAITFKNNEMKSYVDGQVDSVFPDGNDGFIGNEETVRVGNVFSGGESSVNMRLRRMAFIPTAVTDSEAKNL